MYNFFSLICAPPNIISHSTTIMQSHFGKKWLNVFFSFLHFWGIISYSIPLFSFSILTEELLQWLWYIHTYTYIHIYTYIHTLIECQWFLWTLKCEKKFLRCPHTPSWSLAWIEDSSNHHLYKFKEIGPSRLSSVLTPAWFLIFL